MRQPREAVGEPDLLELPAGKLDDEGEAPLETAKRELAEEIGKAAEHWEQLHDATTSLAASPTSGSTSILATGLRDARAPSPSEDERIEIVALAARPTSTARSPRRDDAKTLIGLLLAARALRA